MSKDCPTHGFMHMRFVPEEDASFDWPSVHAHYECTECDYQDFSGDPVAEARAAYSDWLYDEMVERQMTEDGAYEL